MNSEDQLADLQSQLDRLQSRISELEQRVDETERKLRAHGHRIDEARNDISDLERRR